MPDSVVIKALVAGDGCDNFNIFSGSVSQSNMLVTTATKNEILVGVELTGSDPFPLSEVYAVECIEGETIEILNFCTSSTQLPSASCDNTKTYSGNQVFPAYYIVPLGTDIGDVTITYDTKGIPDKIVVDYSGSVVANSGYRGNVSQQSDLNTELQSRGHFPETIVAGTTGTMTFTKRTEEPTFCEIRVYGPLPFTAWEVNVSCPELEEEDTPPPSPPPPTPTPSPVPSCLTGDTGAAGSCMLGQGVIDGGIYDESTFTLAEGFQATITPGGTFYSGYGGYNNGTYSNPYGNPSSQVTNNQILGGQQNAYLLESDNTVLEHFVMAHDRGASPGTSRFYPSSYNLTTPGTYKLRVYHLGCDNGNGTMTLRASNCTELPNQTTSVNNTITSISGVGTSTAFKVVWNSTGYSAQQDAQNLLKFLTGRSSVGSNTVYSISSSLRTRGIKVFDSSSDEKGNINFAGTTSAKYFVDGLQTVVQVTGTSGAGDYVAAATPYSTHKFRQK